jgi:hypothetical protein
MDVRINSTSSDLALNKAVVTVEHVSIASGYDRSNPEHFGDWPNMLEEDRNVDLTKAEGAEDVRLVRDQVPPGDFDGLHVQFSNIAEIEYQNANGKSVQKTVKLSDESHGNVALEFDQMLLKSGGEEATLYLQVDLDRSFPRKEKAIQFQPAMTVDKMTINGEKRAE